MPARCRFASGCCGIQTGCSPTSAASRAARYPPGRDTISRVEDSVHIRHREKPLHFWTNLDAFAERSHALTERTTVATPEEPVVDGPESAPPPKVLITGTGRAGTTLLVQVLTDLGLDRFDADGNSRVAPEPISLPFPEKATL